MCLPLPRHTATCREVGRRCWLSSEPATSGHSVSQKMERSLCALVRMVGSLCLGKTEGWESGGGKGQPCCDAAGVQSSPSRGWEESWGAERPQGYGKSPGIREQQRVPEPKQCRQSPWCWESSGRAAEDTKGMGTVGRAGHRRPGLRTPTDARARPWHALSRLPAMPGWLGPPALPRMLASCAQHFFLLPSSVPACHSRAHVGQQCEKPSSSPHAHPSLQVCPPAPHPGAAVSRLCPTIAWMSTSHFLMLLALRKLS